MTAPKRRRFRFSLRTLFVVVTVFGVWLGWTLHHIHLRRQAISEIEAHGGDVVYGVDLSATYPEVPPSDFPSIPFWRVWLGDKAVAQLEMPDEHYAEKHDVLDVLFPERTIGTVTWR